MPRRVVKTEKKAKTAVKTAVALQKVPQPHGGALYAGGVPGNGGGRPRSVLREQLRTSFAARIPVLESIVDGKPVQRLRLQDGEETSTLISASPADRVRAMDILGKYGVGTVRELSVDHVRERLRQTLEIVRAELPAGLATRVVNRLREVWTQ